MVSVFFAGSLPRRRFRDFFGVSPRISLSRCPGSLPVFSENFYELFPWNFILSWSQDFYRCIFLIFFLVVCSRISSGVPPETCTENNPKFFPGVRPGISTRGFVVISARVHSCISSRESLKSHQFVGLFFRSTNKVFSCRFSRKASRGILQIASRDSSRFLLENILGFLEFLEALSPVIPSEISYRGFLQNVSRVSP